MSWYIYLILAFAFLEGTVVGSFLNVLCDRLPEGKSLWGRSHCDYCGRVLRPRELIPIFSYVCQRGRPSCCKGKLSSQYFWIELATGLAFFSITAFEIGRLGMWVVLTHPLSLFALWVIAATSIAITLIDFRHHIIPDELQIALLLAAIAYHYSWGTVSIMTVASAFVVSIPLLLIYIVTQGRGMGFGDVKLEIGLGAWLLIAKGFIGMYLGFLTGALYGVLLMVRGVATRKAHIAFGPFLIVGAWGAYIWGDRIIALLAPYFIR